MFKPTILFVPGAGFEPTYFDYVTQRLEAAGYKTRRVKLPTNSDAKQHTSFDADVAAVRAELESMIQQDQTVLVVVHSYSSLPAGEAIKGLDLQTRVKNAEKGGVSHILWVCAFLLPESQSLIDAFGGADLPWFNVSEDKLEVKPVNPEKVFCQGMTKEQERVAMASLVPHSYQTFFSPVTFAAWKVVPSTFLYCTKDAAIPLAVQRLMVEQTGKGYDIGIDSVETGHVPFITTPDETAMAIRRAAGEKV